MAFEIKATGMAVPSRKITNEELAEKIDTSDEWIRSHTGIGSRHIAADETASSDLALEAAKNALSLAIGLKNHSAGNSGEVPGGFSTDLTEKIMADEALSLDIIVLATATPDFHGTPSTACLVQEKLGAKNAGAMDITAGCTGFIYALETAAGLLSIGEHRKRALVIGTEILSRFMDWNDRGSCVLFGDGAGAVILEKTEAPLKGKYRRGLIRTILGADGSGAEHLIIRRGGSRFPFKTGEASQGVHIEMNGQAVYTFAVRAVTETIEEMLTKEGLSADALTFIIPHQANARIVQAAANRLGIPEEKFFLNIDEYANTSAASIPIALDELNRAGRISRGDLVLTVGFGGGLTWGANLIVW